MTSSEKDRTCSFWVKPAQEFSCVSHRFMKTMMQSDCTRAFLPWVQVHQVTDDDIHKVNHRHVCAFWIPFSCIQNTIPCDMTHDDCALHCWKLWHQKRFPSETAQHLNAIVPSKQSFLSFFLLMQFHLHLSVRVLQSHGNTCLHQISSDPPSHLHVFRFSRNENTQQITHLCTCDHLRFLNHAMLACSSRSVCFCFF